MNFDSASQNFLNLAQIAAIFAQGEIFAYPTETVFAIGGDPCQELVIEKIRILKQRSAEKSFIIVADNFARISSWVEINPEDLPLMHAMAEEKPTSFLLKSTGKAAKSLEIEGKIALRISPHPVVIRLCQLLKSPIISTSANPSNYPAARTLAQLQAYFPDLPAVQADCGKLPPSRIFDWEKQIFIRC